MYPMRLKCPHPHDRTASLSLPREVLNRALDSTTEVATFYIKERVRTLDTIEAIVY